MSPRDLDDWQRALELADADLRRLQIGRAEGLLMARYNTDAESAFRLLTKLSQESHLKLRDVAARLVANAAGG